MSFKHPPLPPDDAPFDDPDNPEWTAEMFAQARGPDELTEVELAAFPNTRRAGRPPKDVRKLHVNLRLDADVVEHFRSQGPGWQTRINAALRDVLKQQPA
jgi:uncharacterized protein (DUF4415 family)